jgi:hypothetical protein
MAGLDPAIHDFLGRGAKTWMPGTSPGMTTFYVFLARYSSTNVTVSATLAREVR